MDTVDPGSQEGLIRIYNDADEAADLVSLREAIFDRMPSEKRGEQFDLWVDVPGPPTVIKDVVQVKVTSDKKSHRPLSSERFQWEKWTNNYGMVKWKAHVFSLDRSDIRSAASEAASAILEEKYGLRLNAEATAQAKIHED